MIFFPAAFGGLPSQTNKVISLLSYHYNAILQSITIFILILLMTFCAQVFFSFYQISFRFMLILH